jgi:DNA-binding protein HU-beta
LTTPLTVANGGTGQATAAEAVGELIQALTVATKAVEAVLAGIVEGVTKDDKVAIAGFGTFKKKQRKARTGINPATKQPITIEASTTVGFTASPTLKDTMSPAVARR